MPIYAERGRHGGFALRPGWKTTLTGLTPSEAQAVFLSGLPGPAQELGLGGDVEGARLKLLSSLPASWREDAQRVSTRLHLDPVDWYRAPDTPKFLRQVADAVWHAHRLSIDYESWRGATQREREPLGHELKAGAWYLGARTAGQTSVRTYRLASVIAI